MICPSVVLFLLRTHVGNEQFLRVKDNREHWGKEGLWWKHWYGEYNMVVVGKRLTSPAIKGWEVVMIHGEWRWKFILRYKAVEYIFRSNHCLEMKYYTRSWDKTWVWFVSRWEHSLLGWVPKKRLQRKNRGFHSSWKHLSLFSWKCEEKDDQGKME